MLLIILFIGKINIYLTPGEILLLKQALEGPSWDPVSIKIQ